MILQSVPALERAYYRLINYLYNNRYVFELDAGHRRPPICTCGCKYNYV